jgi:hypothetical protein
MGGLFVAAGKTGSFRGVLRHKRKARSLVDGPNLGANLKNASFRKPQIDYLFEEVFGTIAVVVIRLPA